MGCPKPNLRRRLVSRKLTKVRARMKRRRGRPARRAGINLKALVTQGNNRILPQKSRKVYHKMWKAYDSFCSCIPAKDSTPLVDRLLAYFTLLSASYAPSSLWCHQSAIKKKFELEGQDLAVFKKSTSLLKALSKQHAPKQADIFTLQQVHQFYRSVLDQPEVVLACSLLLHGGMRRTELTKLTWNDIEEAGNTLVVTIRESKTDQAGKGHKFVVSAHTDAELCAVKSYRRYCAILRKHLGYVNREERVFHQYHFGRYTRQYHGCHYPARLAKRCAEVNGLSPSKFTAHSWRRTGATLLADAGASPTKNNRFPFFFYFGSFQKNPSSIPHTHKHKTPPPHPNPFSLAPYNSLPRPCGCLGVSLTNLKRFGRWQSSAVAESYVADSAQVKVGLSQTLNSGELPSQLESDFGGETNVEGKSLEEELQFGLGGESGDALMGEPSFVELENCLFDVPMSPQYVCASQERNTDEGDDLLVNMPMMAATEPAHLQDEGPTDEELLDILMALRENAQQQSEPDESLAPEPSTPVSKRKTTPTTTTVTRPTTRSSSRAAALAV